MENRPPSNAVDFSALFELAMDRNVNAVLLLDRTGYIRYANPAAGRLLQIKDPSLSPVQIFDLEENLSLLDYRQRWANAQKSKNRQWLVEWALPSGDKRLFRIHVQRFEEADPPLLCCFLPEPGSIRELEQATYSHLQHFKVVIWEWNLINGDFQATANFFDLLRLNRAELPPARQLNIVSALKDRLPPDEFSRMTHAVKSAQKDRQPFKLKLQLNDESGTPDLKIHLYGTPVAQDGILGKIQGSITLLDNQPSSDEDLASAVVDRSEALICWINPDCSLRYVNRAMAQRLNYAPQQMVGELEITDIDAEHSREQWETFWETAEAGSTMKLESTLRTKNDRVFPAEFHLDFLDINGIKLISLTAQDITGRRQKEADLRQALLEVQNLSEQLEAENVYLKEEVSEGKDFENILTESDNYKKVLQQVEQVAPTEATVLIEGETGTGKELLARAIHNLSKRSDRSLVRVNCAALSEELILSELFGHEKGAFTGATARKTGRFELADKGTIFLDEVGEVSLKTQSQLLRVLQEGEFERVGGVETLKVDVRVIAATNRDLRKMVAEKQFREDLYYRLSVFPFHNPPLRERREDIPLLVRHFMKKFARKNGKNIQTIRARDIKRLQQYNYPGNIRELMNIVEQAVVLTRGRTLDLSYWRPVSPERQPHKIEEEENFPTLEEVQKQHILQALERTQWRVTGPQGAAKLLGMKGQTLFSRMKKLGIKRK